MELLHLDLVNVKNTHWEREKGKKKKKEEERQRSCSLWIWNIVEEAELFLLMSCHEWNSQEGLPSSLPIPALTLTIRITSRHPCSNLSVSLASLRNQDRLVCTQSDVTWRLSRCRRPLGSLLEEEVFSEEWGWEMWCTLLIPRGCTYTK